MRYRIRDSAEIHAAYTVNDGAWGPYHVMVPGPQTDKKDRWGPIRNRNKDKTLCGIRLTDWWERDRVEPYRIQCQRCKTALRKNGDLDPHTRLLPKEIRDRLPPLRVPWPDDPIVHVKYTAAFNDWTWYVIEGEEQENGDWYLYGLVLGFADELGPFMLSELENARGPFGTQVTRDLTFKPQPLSEVWDRWPFNKEE